MDKDELIKRLQEENSLLKYELEKTKFHLKKYTTHVFCNKNLIDSEEKIAEYNTCAYQKLKEKMKKLNRLTPASRL